MHFDYIARDAQGREHRGQMHASDEPAALRQLGAEGMTPVRLRALDAVATAAGTTAQRSLFGTAPRIRIADQTLLLRELATLLGAGVSLGDALPSLAQAYLGQALGAPLQDMDAQVRGGGRLSQALKNPQLALPAFVIALAQAGEASGELARALAQAADQMEQDRKVSEDLRSALIYPSVLVGAGSLAVFFIFVGVVPRFANLIRGARSNVPELSRWVIESGVFVRAHLLESALLIAALVGFIAFGLSHAGTRRKLLQQMQRVPVVGPWLVQAEIGRWAAVLGTLLSNRVPIVQAMALSDGVLRLDRLRDGLQRAARGLQQGQTLADGLASQAWFPRSRLNLIRVGERSGELPKMLLALAQTQTDAARLLQRRMLGLIEPIAILLIGAVIGLVMVAVMMAITSFDTLVG